MKRKQYGKQRALLLLILAFMTGSIIGCESGSQENLPKEEQTAEETAVPETDEQENAKLKTEDISLRDPYVLTFDGKYYLYGTDGDTAFSGEMDSFHAYVSEDLENWDGPYTIYENDGNFWADSQYWAPEVYEKDGEFYFYGSMGGSSRENKGIVLFKSEDPLGPFEPVSQETTITPKNVDAIDATLYEEAGNTYMVYSHGKDGIYGVKLNDTWDGYDGEPFKMFDVSGCGWAVEAFEGMTLNDGPCLYTTSSGKLICFFSTMSEDGYKMGYAVSDNGSISGNWTCTANQMETETDGGHCMIFKNLDGETMIAYHAPNEDSRPVFQYLTEGDDGSILFTSEK